MENFDFAELCITSAASVHIGNGPSDGFRSDQLKGITVVPKLAVGKKCARSWRITTDVGSDPTYPELSARDAATMRELDGKA